MGRSFLKKTSYIRERAPNLNRLNNIREKHNILLLIQFNIRVILDYMYVQLDARLIKEDYKKIVYSWKSFELKLTK